jgi:putative aldouronate transport system substrate-binding protein
LLDGKMYGFPNPGAMTYVDGLVIRKDWLDKLGLEMPKTLDDFLAVAKAFTEQDPDGNGQKDTYGFGAYIESEGLGWLAGMGKRFDFIYGAYGVAGTWDFSDPTTFQLNARNANFMQATQFINTLVSAGAIDPDWPTLKKDEYRARWKQGKYGIINEQFCALICKSNYADFDANFPEGEWAVLQPPTGPDGESSLGASLANARIIAVSQTAVDAGKGPAIASLLEWMGNDEGYFLIGFGEKGVNYNLDEKGFVTTKDIDPALAYTAKEQQPLTQLRNMVFYNSEVELAARYVPWQTQNGRTLDPLALWAEYGEQTWTEATGSAILNPPGNAADFKRFYDEGLVKFILGQQPVNEQTWAKFLQGLDSLGAKEVEAESTTILQASGFLK